MDSRMVGVGLLLALFGVTNAKAEDNESADGLYLYNKQCSVCHGVMADTKTSAAVPGGSKRHPVQVAMAPSAALTVTDFQIPVSPDGRHAVAGDDLHQPQAAARDRIAVAPIYGPPLKDVVGRVAGTFSGFTYSLAFMQKMEGVTWDETKIDVWIKSSQTMVPGSYMFYSQKNPEIRSKIVQYLKEHSQ